MIEAKTKAKFHDIPINGQNLRDRVERNDHRIPGPGPHRGVGATGGLRSERLVEQPSVELLARAVQVREIVVDVKRLGGPDAHTRRKRRGPRAAPSSCSAASP